MYETQAEIDAFFKCLFQFRPVKKLGEGAFGLAILVFDEVEQVQKVFKVPRNNDTTEALQKEGANLVKLSELLHPNIIRLHQYGKVRMTWDGKETDRYYINMAFGGSSLRGKLGRLRKELDENGNERLFGSGRRLALDEALKIAIDVCNGLEAAHGFRGARIRMLHRDIKPANILIDDKTGIGRLADFGLSRVIARSSSQVSGAGTYLYMDPECFHGRATVTSDLYSLGIVLYEMITGDLPFYDFKHRFDGPARPPTELVADLPSEIDDITLRAMSSDVESRYPDASTMLVDLRRLAAKLNPLPERFTRLSELAGGRCLCQDEEADERVVVRLVSTPAPLSEFAQQCNRLERAGIKGVGIPLRHFTNEQYVGIVERASPDLDLQKQFEGKVLGSIASLEGFCKSMADVCELVAILHREGIIHGLLSPFCILVGADGPCVYDTGLSPILRARHASGEADQSLESLGAILPFMSPQMLGAAADPSPSDDVYAVGAIMYFLLSGQPAIGQEDRHRLMLGGSVAEPGYNLRDDNRLVPPAIAAAVAKALHFNEHDRFSSIHDMSVAIRSCCWPTETVDAIVADALEAFPEAGDAEQLIQACDLLKLALQIEPGSPRAHFARGVVYFRDRSYRFAIDEFTKAALVSPSTETLALLAQAYEHDGKDLSKAVGAYERALQHGDDPAILERLAKLLKRIDRPRRAIRVLQQSIDCERDESLRQRRTVLLNEWTGGEGETTTRNQAKADDVGISETETKEFQREQSSRKESPDHETKHSK